MKSKRIICLLLAFLMLFIAVSCGKEDKITEVADEEVKKAAVPGTGVYFSFSEEVREPEPDTGYTVCLDPGHGFVDGGSGEDIFPDGILEKDVNMQIALKVMDELEMLGYDVFLTHDGENIPSADTNGNQIFNVTERTAYVNTLDIDYLLSIHADTSENVNASGVRLYYYQGSRKLDSYSVDFAESIASAIHSEMPEEPIPQTVDQSSDPNNAFAMVRDTIAAASLIEVGFSTNETDLKNMIDDEWQTEIALAIAHGIDDCFKQRDS